jgi:hypothetical protein
VVQKVDLGQKAQPTPESTNKKGSQPKNIPVWYAKEVYDYIPQIWCVQINQRAMIQTQS